MNSDYRKKRPDRELKYDETGQVKMSSSVDDILKENSAYQYLCHVHEVRIWLEKVGSGRFEIPDEHSIIDFENSLRNGVILAKLGLLLFPDEFPERCIFDMQLEIYQNKGLVFRHIDNINTYYRIMEHVGLPKLFFPVTTDIYDRKNMPKLIYSIHALATFLYRKGLVKIRIGDEFGKVKFNKEELSTIQQEFQSLNISMPQFGKIGGILAKNLKKDEAHRFASIVKINEAIDEMDSDKLITNLIDPECELENVDEDLKEGYLTLLSVVKKKKIEENAKIIEDTPIDELDYFVKNLTLEAIQETIENGNLNNLLHLIDQAIVEEDQPQIIALLREPILRINQTIFMDHSEYYLSSLIDYRLHQESASLAKSSEPQTLSYILEREQVEMAVEEANRDIESEIRLMQALDKLNKSITEKDEQQMLEDLANPELKIENIKPENSGLYLDNLNKSLDNNPDSLDITNIQKIINESNGVKETRIKINNIVDEIFERAKEDDFDKVSDLLSSNLLDFKFEKANVAIYSSFLKENKSSGSAQNEQVDGDNSSQYADLGLQQSDFDSLLEEKLEKISKAIEAGDKMTIDAKNLAELTISLENCESDPSVIEKYASSELTGLKHLMHSDRAQLYAKFLSQKFHKNHRLHRSLAISGTQTSDVQASGEVLTDVKQTNSVKSNEDGGNVAENDYDGPKLAITEYPGEDPDFFRCVTQNGREFIYDESLNMVIWDASESPKYLNKVSNNPKRLTIHKMESILKKANEFHATASHTAEIEKLQEIIKMQLLHSKYRDRFNKIAKQNIRIKKVQQFFRNLVGRNDFHNLMSGEKVRFPVVLKFIKILMPTDYDLEKMLELSDLKSEVRGMIIRIQEKETTVKDLELLCSLLVQSKYSESVKDKAIPTAVTSGYLRQERVETLRFYGKFLFCLITFDKYFAQLMYLLDKNEIFDISSTVIPIFNYISTPREEVRILKCILRSITWYIQDEDSLNLLASGFPNPFKLALDCSSYLKKDHFHAFLECFRKPVNNIISKCSNSEEMTNQSSDIFSINPIQIYVELKQSEAALDLSVAKVMEDHSVALRLKKNIDIVIELVESLMNSLRTCVPYMPYLYRAIVQFVWCEVEGLDQKHRIQIVSNLVLSKLVAQMITLPEQFDYTDKKPGEIGERQRKLMTLVAGIVVAIGMNQKFKGDHLEKLDKYVLEKHQEWLAIVEKISDIPNITENYQVPKQSEFIDDSESVTVRIEKIVALHEYILKYKSELCVKENDLLAPLLAEFPEPKIENFLRDPNVNAVTKKEMSRKLVTIELVRQVKVATKRKEDTPKHLMIRLKILFSQLLFAIDRSKFSPERIQDILEHEWLESEISKHASNNQLLKGLSDSAGQNYTSPASSQLSFSLNTLPEITKQCRDILESLVKLGTLTPDDDYDVLVQQIASDIRSEHSRKIEMRHEISLLTVTKTKLVESSDHLDKKIPFLESYITSLKSNLSNKKKRQKRTRFFSTRSSSSSTSGNASKSNNSISKTSSFVGKKQTYSVEKLMKRQTIRKFSHADVKNLKGVQIRLVEEKPSQFTATLLVIGNPIEEKSISTSDVILMTYNKKETVDLFKGVTFDTKALYKILVSK